MKIFTNFHWDKPDELINLVNKPLDEEPAGDGETLPVDSITYLMHNPDAFHKADMPYEVKPDKNNVTKVVYTSITLDGPLAYRKLVVNMEDAVILDINPLRWQSTYHLLIISGFGHLCRIKWVDISKNKLSDIDCPFRVPIVYLYSPIIKSAAKQLTARINEYIEDAKSTPPEDFRQKIEDLSSDLDLENVIQELITVKGKLGEIRNAITENVLDEYLGK